MPQSREAPAAPGHERPSLTPLLPCLTAALGLCLAIAAFLVVWDLRDSRNLADLRNLAEDRLTLMATRLQTTLFRLEALRAFWLASQEVRADEFELFASQLIAGDPAIQALEWAPRIAGSRRETFEAEANSLFPGYRIRELAPDGSVVPAASRAEYFPILYVHPVEGNERAPGFDLASEASRREALDHARDLGAPVASRPLNLQAREDTSGFLCVWPLDERGHAHDTVEARREALRGYLVGVYRIAAIVEPLLGSRTPASFHMRVDATSPTGTLHTLYDSTPAQTTSAATLQIDRELTALGTEWRIVCAADESLLGQRRGPWPWIALGAGLLFTLLATLAIVQKQARAEALARVNEQLVREALLMESLQQTQRLESLGVLAGGIAHDFNNLLTGILGNSDLALHLLAHDHAAREPVANARVAARRAADLTAQLLAYAGRANLEREPLDLSAMVRDMEGLLQTAIPSGVELVRQLAPDLPSIKADKAQLQQVLLNLVMNGAEACRETGGTVRIQTRAAAPSDRTMPARRVLLEVTDTGVGMPPDVKRRMFEPFFTTKFQGRGLGLASVQGIVRAHNGVISVESEPGAGTCIRVELPAVHAAAVAEGPPVPTGLIGHGAVLLVDDDALVLNVGGKILEGFGFEVFKVADSEQALDLFRREHHRIQLAILDLTMPGMNGVELMRSLRYVEPRLLVLLSSGYHESELGGVVDEHNGVGFLQKPYTRETMAARVQRVLNSGMAASQRTV
ncbi:MAG TPA: CHASE domain-containing protein [Planctomycetota bacterium]|nr:CHASE domain-containing protein [Planctomycetota bacterium]